MAMKPTIAHTLLKGSNEKEITIRTEDIFMYAEVFKHETGEELGFRKSGDFWTIYLLNEPEPVNVLRLF